MKLKNQEQILDISIRKGILEEIAGTENNARKADSFRRYECLKDRADNYVFDLLLCQFDGETVNEMQYAVTNISFARKILDKLSKVYALGAKRIGVDEESTAAIEAASEHLDMNTKMKKLNKYLKAFRNTIAYVKPVKKVEGGVEKYDLSIQVIAPHLYDVCESPDNPEAPMVVILSSYSPRRTGMYAVNAATAGRTPTGAGVMYPVGGVQKVETIANSPLDKEDDKDKTFIWWSKDYHFTTDKKGNIISDTTDNPINKLPMVNFAYDQDGAFWAIGGGDIFDSSIKINALMTHINHIAVQQGYGQLYMTGKDLPQAIKVGPNQCIRISQEEGAPDPKIGFLSANPPVNELMGLIEMYVALMLSTNNLSTSGFSSNLKGSAQFASGLALMIDKAESIEDVKDQSQIFRENEHEIWEIVAAWMLYYKTQGLLEQDLDEINLPEEIEMIVSFPDAQPIYSEAEKLDIIQKRKDLGINTEIELLMKDDQSLNEKTAEEKLLKITQERLGKMFAPTAQQTPMQNDMAGADMMSTQNDTTG